MRGLIKRRTRDTLAVIAFAALIVGCTVSTWALLVMAPCALAAMGIDPESSNARAREYRRQQRAADMRQRGLIPVQTRQLDCGCFEVPAQTVRCPADAALADIEAMADGHG